MFTKLMQHHIIKTKDGADAFCTDDSKVYTLITMRVTILASQLNSI